MMYMNTGMKRAETVTSRSRGIERSARSATLVVSWKNPPRRASGPWSLDAIANAADLARFRSLA